MDNEKEKDIVNKPQTDDSLNQDAQATAPLLSPPALSAQPHDAPYPQQANPPVYAYPTQSYPQPYPNQPPPPNLVYPNQPYPTQPYPNQPYPNQPYPNQPYPNQPYPNQAFPNQPYPNQPYPNQPYQPPTPPYLQFSQQYAVHVEQPIVVVHSPSTNERPLACGGLGVAWLFFILGWFFGIFWFIGAFYACAGNPREKRAGRANLVAAVILTVIILIGVVMD